MQQSMSQPGPLAARPSGGARRMQSVKLPAVQLPGVLPVSSRPSNGARRMEMARPSSPSATATLPAQVAGKRTFAQVIEALSKSDSQPAEWPAIADAAGQDVLEGYMVWPGHVPASVPTPTVPCMPHTTTEKSVLFIRDTHGWCPFCERVWLALEEKGVAYDTMLVNLRSKPEWYKDLVPTQLVPAAHIRGRGMVWESRDILLALEEAFPDELPLLPADPAARGAALEAMDGADAFSKVAYAFMAGRNVGGDTEGDAPPADEAAAARRAVFEDAVFALDAQLAMGGGPFFLGAQFSLVDVMYVPSLERMAANLPLARGFAMRGNARLPHLAAWYDAMDKRASYQKVKSDDTTLQLISRRVFNAQSSLPTGAGLGAAHYPARREAAAKLTANREAVVRDILSNTGLVHTAPASEYGSTAVSINGRDPQPTPCTVAAVEYTLRRLCEQLLTGSAGARHADQEAAAIGAAALSYLHNRVSAPRDMSAAAATELRAACMDVLRDLY